MALALPAMLSTASLVTVRSAGVAARSLGLLTLAAGMPAERFAHYATAFVLSELARCATDFGLDPLVLRRAEGLRVDEQRPMIRAALAVRLTHGLIAAAVVVAILALSFPLDLLLLAAGLQFLAQGWLQLGLNWRQVNNDAHRAAPALLAFYAAVAGIAALAYFHPALGAIPLPLLLAGEALIAVRLLAPLARPRRRDLAEGYASLVPKALPMAGIMLLAFVNTRADALLVGRLLSADEAGRYLYLVRFVDFAPMLTTGVALPLVGKLSGFDMRRHAAALVALALALAAAPFVLVAVGALLNPAYAGDATLRLLIAAIAVVRIGLAVTTVLLLAQWRDWLLVRVATVTTVLVPVLCWLLGSRYGGHGLAVGVIVAEAGNLLFQTGLLLARRTPQRVAASGPSHD
jgi:O-antigen/teichoic acid export membrane protein